jgi:hypothetical protein
MALNAGKIHLGACRIFAGVTPAVTGTPPTYTTHTDGIPASGTEMGLTQGDTTFVYNPEQKLIEAEQALGYINTFTINQRASLEFTCLEQTYFALQQAFNSAGTETISAGDAFYWGGGNAALVPNTTCVMATARQPYAPTKFIIVQLYKVATVAGYQIPLSRTKESMFRVRFEAMEDTSRNAGDRAGYYRFEK